MADYEARIAPFINVEFYVTSYFGEPRTRKRPTQTELTLQHQVRGNNLYSMTNGTIITKEYDAGGFGNYIIIKGNDGKGFLYAHMREASPLAVGDSVKIGDYVGHEGTTGNSTGIHLHLEMQDLSNRNWIFGGDLSQYLNPADFMGIPNEANISCIYSGTPKPPTPQTRKKNKFKWVLYLRKIRNRNKF